MPPLSASLTAGDLIPGFAATFASSPSGQVAEVLRTVRLVTHTPAGDYGDYVAELAREPTALRVKLADMLHNLRTGPSDRQRAKYGGALARLGTDPSSPPAGIAADHWRELLRLVEPGEA